MGRIATSSALLSLAFVFIVLSLTMPFVRSHLSEKKEEPCCEICHICTRSIPPYCVCDDLLLSCPPMCQNCVKAETDTSGNPPLYQCRDFLFDPCNLPCANASSIHYQ